MAKVRCREHTRCCCSMRGKREVIRGTLDISPKVEGCGITEICDDYFGDVVDPKIMPNHFTA